MSGLFLFLAFLIFVSVLLTVMILHHRKGARGDFNLMNRLGMVETTIDPEGSVLIGGEVWRALSETEERLERGRQVRVCGARKHLLIVAPE
jgi:membrane-bound ClpP family serine protease